jgi:hypothetical protein
LVKKFVLGDGTSIICGELPWINEPVEKQLMISLW